jgi:hypothetical protein
MRPAVLLLLALIAPAVGAEPAAKPTPGHLAAAMELVDALNLTDTAMAGASVALDAQIAANPDLEPYRDVMKSWAGRTLSKENMQPRLAALYADAFTEAELRQLISFYKTPVGRKALDAMPRLMQEGAEIGKQLADEHAPELQKMIADRDAELKGGTQPAPPPATP